MGVLFDPNCQLNRLNFQSENPDLVIGQTGQLYKVAELLNEAHSKLYSEKVKDLPTRGPRNYEVMRTPESSEDES